jgi:tetratricopeptide (TPR) repeat protein
MNRVFKNPALVLAVIVFCAASLLSQAGAGDELNLGVHAYKQARYAEAILHFQKAAELDPSNIHAHLYLATCYAQQYIPGAETPENLQMAELAIEQYQHVLDSDAAHTDKSNSAKGIAYLYLQMKKFEDSKKHYQMASDLDPKDPEPYYSIGVMAWTICYQPRMEERARLGVKPDQALDPAKQDQRKACEELKLKSAPIIEEGIDHLNQAIKLRPDYDDAMAYINLMYREKADLECDDPTARREDLKIADDWVDKMLATKKTKAEKTLPSLPNRQ